MLSDLIYIKELPDIDIIELVDGDEYVDNNGDGDGKIGLNVYMDNDDVDEIYEQLRLLLYPEFLENADQKASIFNTIHKNLIAQRPSIPHQIIPANLIPEVGINRKKNGETDGGDDEFHEEYEIAKKISSFEQRRHEMHKIFFGFDSVDDDPPLLPPIIRPTQVYYLPPEYGVLQSTILLPADNITPSVNHLHMINGLMLRNPTFYALKLVDKIGATPKTPDGDYATNENTILTELITKIIQTAVDEQLYSIDKVGTLYDIWRTFMEVGVDTNTYVDNAKYMTVDVIAQLVSILEEIRDIDTDIEIEPLKRTTDRAIGSSPLKPLNDTCSIAGFYNAQEKSFTTLKPVITQIKNRLLDLYNNFYASLSSDDDNLSLPNNAHDIMEMLSKDEVTIKDLIKRMRRRILYQEREFIQDWFKRIDEWTPDTAEAKLYTENVLAQKTLESIFDDANEQWGSIVKEISHIKRGEVISKDYEDADAPGADVDVDRSADGDDFAFEGTDPEESRVPILDDRIPIDISHLQEGTQEIYKIVLGMFVQLQRSSGLPLDYTRMTLALPDKLRKTKKSEICERILNMVPSNNLINTLINDLIDATPENIRTIITNNVSDAIIQKSILVTFYKIYEEYLDDIKNMWLHLLGWWVCEIQQHVLNNSLQFNVAWEGFFECIDMWTPFGYPMDKNETSRTEGVLPYLICIILKLNTTPGSLWCKFASKVPKSSVKPSMNDPTKDKKDWMTSKDIHMHLNTLYAGVFENRVKMLQTHFLNFDKETGFNQIVKRGNAIKNAMNETFNNKVKSRYIVDYINFLMNLPSILIYTSRYNKKLKLGCCTQILDENYRADLDWQGIAPFASKIKLGFAKQRVGFERRPILMFAGRIDATSAPIVERRLLPPSPIFVDWELDDMIRSLDKYMPEPDFNLFNNRTHPHLIVTKITDYLDILEHTVLGVDNAFKNFVENRSNKTLLEATRSLLQIQSYMIHTDYINNPSEYNYLKKSFEDNLGLYEMLLNNARMLKDRDEMRHKRVIQYFFIRQLCFPAKPESARQGTLVMGTNIPLDSSLLPNFLSNSIDKIKSWMVTKDFNTSVNYIQHLTEAREKENVSKMAAINNMTPEERAAYKLSKKLNLPEADQYREMFAENPKSAKEGEGDPLIDTNENNDDNDEEKLSD